ncbi:hypothetical protein K458DRAFT_260856, partial [Lentithecium fluviatile CBS 122367]
LCISFLLCFISGLLLSVVLLCKDASQLRKNRHSRFWEKTVALFFNLCQVGLCTAGIVATMIAFTKKSEPHWLNTIFLSTLQLFAGANVS